MQYFDIILFAIVAGVLAIRLYKLLGKKSDISFNKDTNIEFNNLSKNETAISDDQTSEINEEGIKALKKLDIDFKEKSFLEGAEKAFKLIIEAFNYDDKKTLRSFLEDDVYRVFEKVIIEREQKGLFIENPIKIEMKQSKIESARIEDGVAIIRVLFNSLQTIIMKSIESDAVMNESSTPQTKTDLWEFRRELKSTDPNWKLTYTESG